MKTKLEDMRKFEIFNNIKIPPNCWFIARLDGKGFNKLTKKMNLKKPFDENFKKSIVEAIKKVMFNTGAILSYFESDEISILFKKDSDFFNRRIEKINSILSSMMTTECMTQDFFKGFLPIFDCRLLVCPIEEDVFNVFKWRLNDSLRNCLNSYAFWNLVFSGKTNKQATKILQNMKANQKQELLFKKFGINFNDVEKWKKNGTFIFIKEIDKEGFNPKENKKVIVKRNVFKEISKDFKEQKDFYKKLLKRGLKN